MQRAETFEILRRAPLEGFHITFTLTNYHCEQMSKQRLSDFICQFIEQLIAEISELKLAMNARSRAVAQELLQGLTA